MKAFALFIISALSLFAVSAECPEGMISYWSFDDSNQPFLDEFGNNSGECSDSHCPLQVQGFSGLALSFDGTDDYVKIKDSDDLSFKDEGSIFAWVYLFESSGYRAVATKGTEHWMGFFNGTYLLRIDSGSSDGRWQGPLIADRNITPDEWHFIGYTLKEGERTIYIDGKKAGSDLNGSVQNNTGNNMYIGACTAENPQGDFWFKDKIDEVMIFSRALDTDEVNKLFLSYKETGSDCKKKTADDTQETAKNFKDENEIDYAVLSVIAAVIIGLVVFCTVKIKKNLRRKK